MEPRPDIRWAGHDWYSGQGTEVEEAARAGLQRQPLLTLARATNYIPAPPTRSRPSQHGEPEIPPVRPQREGALETEAGEVPSASADIDLSVADLSDYPEDEVNEAIKNCPADCIFWQEE